MDGRTVLLRWGQIVSVGATRVQSVLEGPAEEGRTYSGNQLQTGHSLEVYEGKCSRGQLVWNTKRKRLWQVESRAGEERKCEIRDLIDFTSSASPAAWWIRLCSEVQMGNNLPPQRLLFPSLLFFFVLSIYQFMFITPAINMGLLGGKWSQIEFLWPRKY